MCRGTLEKVLGNLGDLGGAFHFSKWVITCHNMLYITCSNQRRTEVYLGIPLPWYTGIPLIIGYTWIILGLNIAIGRHSHFLATKNIHWAAHPGTPFRFFPREWTHPNAFNNSITFNDPMYAGETYILGV